MTFMKHLNKIVSFNTRDPFSILGVSFTETPTLNQRFNWMDYDTSCFLQNIGLIAFLFILIVIRQLFGLLIYLLKRNLKQTHCLR